MTFADLLRSPLCQVYFASLDSAMLLLMLLMSWRLFQSRRSKAYFTLTLSLLVALLAQGLPVAAEAAALSAGAGFFAVWVQLMKVAAFIFINLGIYKLYNASRFRVYAIFFGALGGAVAVSFTRILIYDRLEGTAQQIRLLGDIGLDLYLFLLLFLCYHWITPWIHSGGAYTVGLALYFTHHLLHMANVYVLDEPLPYVTVASQSLLTLYYVMLFVVLFERVVERLMTTYRKSITDGLTGLYNRRYFMAKANQYIRHGIPVSVIFIDIDNFKKLNDTQGHQKGDEALKAVAAILMEEAEDAGLLAGRLGGEEMVVLVTDPELNAAEFAEKIRARVEAEAGVTVSIGCSKHRKGMTAEELVKQADEAMYQAKATGKNKVVKYTRQKQINLKG